MVVVGNEVVSGRSNNENKKEFFGEQLTASSSSTSNSLFLPYESAYLSKNSDVLSIVSSHHSEIHLDSSRSKEEPVLQSFRLSKSERILGLERTKYRYQLNSSSSDTLTSRSSPDFEEDREILHSTLNQSSLEDHQETAPNDIHPVKSEKDGRLPKRTFPCANASDGIEEVSVQSHSSLPPNINNSTNIPKGNLNKNTTNGTQLTNGITAREAVKLDNYKISDPREDFISQVKSRVYASKIRGKNMFQDCLVITNRSIYILRLDRDPITLFIEAAMQGDVKTSEKLAATFDLDAKALLELAADIKLSEGDFAGAIALYRLSGCKHLKAVLKFAASGHVHELLSYLSVLFKTPNLDVSNSDRIHLSNLTLMAYFQQGKFQHY